MNKDIIIAKKTVEEEIRALKKLFLSFNRSSQFSKAVNLIIKTKGKCLVEVKLGKRPLKAVNRSVLSLNKKPKQTYSSFNKIASAVAESLRGVKTAKYSHTLTKVNNDTPANCLVFTKNRGTAL